MWQEQSLFKDLAELSHNMIFVNHQGRVVYVNQRCVDVMGYTREEFYHPKFNFLSLISPLSLEAVRSFYQAHQAGRDISPYDCVLIKKNGEEIRTIIASKLMRRGGENYIAGIVTDVTQKAEEVKTVHFQLEQLISIFDGIKEPVYVCDPAKHELLYANEAFKKCCDEAILNRPCEELLKGLTGPCSECPSRAVQETERSHVWEAENPATKRWFRRMAQAIRWPDGRNVRYEMAIDITAGKQAEFHRDIFQERLRDFAECSSDLAWETDAEGCYLFLKGRVQELLGVDASWLIEKNVFELVVEEQKERTQQYFTELRTRRERMTDLETWYATPQGSRVCLMTSAVPVLTPDGRLAGYRGIHKDMTARKKAQEALEHSRNMAQLVMNNIPQYVFWKDRQSVYLGCNENFARAAGVANPEEIVGKTDYDLAWKKEEADFYREVDRRVMASDRPEYHIIESQYQADGKQAWLDTNKVPLHDEQGRVVGILGAYEDITDRIKAEQNLKESETNFRALAENANDGIMILTGDASIVYANRYAFEMTGHEPSEIGNLNLRDVAESGEHEKVLELYQSRLQGDSSSDKVETVFRHKKGKLIPVEVSGGSTVWKGQPADILIVRDISERKKAEATVAKLSSAIEQTADSVMITDRNGIIQYVNNGFIEMTGYSREETVSKKPSLLRSGLHHDFFYEQLWRTILSGQVFRQPLINKKKNGDLYNVELTITPVKNEAGEVTHFVSVGKDVTEYKKAEEKLIHSAFHDALTDLPSRALLIEKLSHAILRQRRNEAYQYAVLYMDLDRFKIINDSLGHLMGDKLLIAIAQKLRGSLRSVDTIARVGGDEFVILSEDLRDNQQALEIASRIQELLSTPFDIEGQEIYTSASIGIALSSTGYDSSDSVLRDADTAMYLAKAHGKARYEVFDKKMHAKVVSLLELENDLRRALERLELCLFYQPIIEVGSGRMIGFESLIRWRHPRRGLIFPNDFISLAEETGLIVPMGRWVIQEACRQLKVWQKKYSDRLPMVMSVNVSGKQYQQPDLVDDITRTLQENNIHPSSLKLEITENVLLEDNDIVLSNLAGLEALGVELYMDDFGTGYSSLNYLRSIRIEKLKIDKSFVGNLGNRSGDLEIIRGIVALAHNLGISVIAEGVERMEQLEHLRQMNCDFAQGYYFSKPVNLEEAESIIISHLER